MPAANLVQALSKHKVVVCCGSGGVGKTTVSAALGMAMVAQHQRRVLVLTIDPARRLATALGISVVGTEPVRIPRTRLRKALGVDPKGEMFAAMLDMKSMWDLLVERAAPTPQVAARIVKNRFYQGISDAFVGSQEYAAMEALYELNREGDYDCLIIDTPPSRNALDFLEAPDRLADFVGARMLSWLAGPSRLGFRAINLAAAPFLRLADRLLGSEMLSELSAFVRDLQSMYGSIQTRAREVYRLLRSSETAFVVVTTLEPAPFAEAEYFVSKLKEFSMPLRGIVVNRVLPEGLCDAGAVEAAHSLLDDAAVVRQVAEVSGERVTLEAARSLGAAFLLLHGIADRDRVQARRLARLGHVPMARVGLADKDVSDVDALAAVAAVLRGVAPG